MTVVQTADGLNCSVRTRFARQVALAATTLVAALGAAANAQVTIGSTGVRDINGDGTTDGADLSILHGAWS